MILYVVFNMMDVLQTNLVSNNILITSSKCFLKAYFNDNSYHNFSSKYIEYQKLDLSGFISKILKNVSF